MKAMLLLFTLLVTMIILFIPTLLYNYDFIMEWNLFSYGALSFSVPLFFDKISTIFSCTVIVISLSVMSFAVSYMSKDDHLEYFTIMVMIFILSMNCLIFFPNMMMLLLGWDGLGLSSYLLVIYYMNDKSLSAGMLTAMTNRIGDAMLILAISWAFSAGHWSFTVTSMNMNLMIAMAVITAAMTKSAQLPFSSWLPAAMAAPTPVSALVHSSTLVTAGVFLLIRHFPSLSMFLCFKVICFYLGAITCYLASYAAMFEFDLKKIIAYSTLSQLGIMMISLGMEQPMIAFFHLITHALFKALLFICAGTIIHMSNNNQDIRFMPRMDELSPITTTTFITANLALCGIPFTAGFYSKDSIVETFFLTQMPLSTSIIMIPSCH